MLDYFQKINWIKTIIALIVILLTEVFVWNHSFWLTSNYCPIYVDELYTETGSLFEMGNDYTISDNSYLEIRNINQTVKNLSLNVWTRKEAEKMF